MKRTRLLPNLPLATLLLATLLLAPLVSSAWARQEVGSGAAGEESLSPPGSPARDTLPEEIWIEARQAYGEGRYGVATALYQGLVERGVNGGWVQYNLGNSLLRRGELGRAIAAYRAATTRLPRNGDVRANLSFARQSARDALSPPEPAVVVRTLFFWHFALSRAELLRWFLVSNALLWSLLALRLFFRRTEVLGWIATAALIVTVATGGSLAVRYVAPLRIAVVTAPEIGAHTGTRDDTVVRFKLHAGSEVRLVERRGEWLRIRLPDGQQAWIDARYAAVVNL